MALIPIVMILGRRLAVLWINPTRAHHPRTRGVRAGNSLWLALLWLLRLLPTRPRLIIVFSATMRTETTRGAQVTTAVERPTCTGHAQGVSARGRSYTNGIRVVFGAAFDAIARRQECVEPLD